ncbi:LytR/AlgR family response regulator transcription factor [Aliikangiella sp. IMCC44359]|uniref:LytR/AlgR family response regulator transcription factor n=1 Tax=Aliikangiella sp. IMCC44359 TaxID=3459125 RepID=UPI00403AE28A
MKEKISVLIVDDEAAAREKLQRYVDLDNRFDVIGQAGNGQEAIDKITRFQPEVLLLDIQMPGMSGFDVLRLKDGSNTAVIFTTAYDEYAVKAFEVSAVDYILKPISESRLKQALDKVSKHLKLNWNEKINSVLDNLPQKNYIQQIAVRQAKRIKLLKIEDINFIRSEHRLINIYSADGERFWTNESLTQLESRLDPKRFMRVHRSSLVNLDADFDIEIWDSGRLKIHFSDGNHLVVSRENAERLRDRLKI